jgi:cytochrome c oxidase subunit 4
MAEHAATTHPLEESAEEQESHIGTYLRVFGALLVFTILEYFYAKIFADHFVLLVFGLMTLASVKAGLVGIFFMHLKFEGRWVYYMLVPAAFLATVLMCGLYPDMAIHYVSDYSTADDDRAAVAAPVAPGVGSSTSPGRIGH